MRTHPTFYTLHRFYIKSLTQDQLKRLCEAVETICSRIIALPRGTSRSTREGVHKHPQRTFADYPRERPGNNWLKPVSPQCSITTSASSPSIQTSVRATCLPAPGGSGEQITTAQLPVRTSDGPTDYGAHPPVLGGHTMEVSSSLEYDDEQTQGLLHEAVVVTGAYNFDG